MAALIFTFCPASILTSASALKLKFLFVRILISFSAYKNTCPDDANSIQTFPSLLIKYTIPVVSSNNSWLPWAERILMFLEFRLSSSVILCPPNLTLKSCGSLGPGVSRPNTSLGDSLLALEDPAPLVGSSAKPCLTICSLNVCCIGLNVSL